MIGVVTVDGRPVGRRNKLHVPHEAAAIVTITRPASMRAGIVSRVSEHERFLRAFHATHPGITARAMERGGSYDRLAARATGDVLDLACGDGVLLRRLPPSAIGIDVSREELGATPRVVQGRAQQLPFATGVFHTVTCHLAFMLFDDVPAVVRELHRVLASGGAFVALLGGGPTATGDDAFHRFLAALRPHITAGRRSGDPRAKSEAGWRELFAGWGAPSFERWELDLGGTFDEVWTFLGATYELAPELAPEIREELRAYYADERVPCNVVTWCASVRR